MKIAFSTGNRGKLKEAGEILGEGFTLTTPADLGIDDDVEETGETLKDNSILKARFLYDRTGLDCFADDTGLEVDALGGAPGVYTARYAGESCNFDDNMDKLLVELGKLGRDVPRTAHFKCVVTLILDGVEHYFEGSMDGTIALSKSGCKGFGYDPVFIPDCGDGRTLAEMSEEEKNAISHRGMAVRKMAAYLKSVGR